MALTLELKTVRDLDQSSTHYLKRRYVQLVKSANWGLHQGSSSTTRLRDHCHLHLAESNGYAYSLV